MFTEQTVFSCWERDMTFDAVTAIFAERGKWSFPKAQPFLFKEVASWQRKSGHALNRTFKVEKDF